MLPRIKTLPFPTVATARPRTRSLAPVALGRSLEDPAPVLVLGHGPQADRARVALARLGLRADSLAQLVLVAGSISDQLIEVKPDAPAPRFWTIVPPGDFAPATGISGLVLDPVTPALIEALRAEQEIAEGTDPGRSTRETLFTATLLEDADAFQAQLADAFGAAACHVWIREGGELRALARVETSLVPAAFVAAESGGRVVVDDDGISTWIGVWCVRAPGEEPAGLLALRYDGVTTIGSSASDLELIANRAGIELSWLRVHRRMVAEQERLRAAAMIEPLTGAWTRAAFERTVEVELAGARRRGEPLAFAVFDVDQLRHVNHLQGHAAGDAVLAHVAAVVRANVRVNDEIGRFGDDELAVLLMGADLDRAKPVIDKLVRKIHETPLIVNGERIQFSVRAGVTGVTPADRAGDLVFARAVRALEDAAASDTRVASCTELAAASGHALDDDAQVGTLVGATLPGGYRIVHEINRGAHGVVYRGEDLGLGRPVAIKVLRADMGHDEALVAKFRREASILASLRHNNLVEVYAFGATEQVFFVMELVEGPTVADVVDEALMRGEWLDADAIAELVQEVADALETMHAAGLVHCDVKPENIVLDRNAHRAVLVDIGECKRHDEDRRRAGTPGYAAPESFGQAEETALIDTYSLGATAYMMLTARLPFGTGDALSILARQLDAPPTAPSQIRSGLPAAVDAVILKALAVDPALRFGTPGAFAAALRTAVRGTAPSAELPAMVIDRNLGPGQLRELTMDSIILPAEQASRPMVRGAAFRVAAKVLAARVGEPWLRRIAEQRRDLGEALLPTVPPMSWQPLDLLIDLIAQTDGVVDYPELLRTIGRGTVAVTFGHVYGADPSQASTHGLLTSVPRLWSRYFDFASIEVIGAGDDRVVLRVPGPECLGNVGALVAGVLERIAELTGATNVKVGVVTDGTGTTFTVEWCDDE